MAHIAERADDARFPVVPQRLVADVRKVMPDDGIICLDNGMYKIWFARNYRTHMPIRSFSTTRLPAWARACLRQLRRRCSTRSGASWLSAATAAS